MSQETAPYVLVKYHRNYSDEFDCEGFGLFKRAKWDDICDLTKSNFDENGGQSTSFGTNEELEFSNYHDWIRSFDVCEVSQQQADVIFDLFSNGASSYIEYGTGTQIFNIYE